ncbi:hypothetical protein DMUE_3035 [Dictyocoela muelleri]|nr:hypothetical protein DMUE_3035 [Dictyocoela muelleri]
MILKLYTLVSLEEQNILNWRTSFKELSRICNCSDTVMRDVLRQIVNINLQHQIGDASTADEILYKLIKLKYNNNTVYKYQNQISNIRQTNFFTIRAYLYEITTATHKLALCLDWNETATAEKVRELFYSGLDDSVKFKIMKNVNRDFDTVFKTLVEMENFIIENIRKRLQEKMYPHNNASAVKNDRRFSKKYSKQENQYNVGHKHDKTYGNKFCSLHKTNSHSSSECRVLKRQSEKKKNFEENPKKTYTINETRCVPKTLEIPMEINNKTFTASLIPVR